MFCLAVIVCFGPLSAFHLLRAAKLINNGNMCEKIFETGSFLVHVFPVLNAILYSFIGPRFRRDLRNFLSRVRGPQGDYHKRFQSIVVLIETVFRERNQYEYGNGTYTNIAFGTSAPVPSKHAKVVRMLMRL